MIGGFDGDMASLATVRRYDPGEYACDLLADMPTTRRGLAAVVVDGRIYAMGGFDGDLALAATAHDPYIFRTVQSASNRRHTTGTPASVVPRPGALKYTVHRARRA